jgi:hypothetical protein
VSLPCSPSANAFADAKARQKRAVSLCVVRSTTFAEGDAGEARREAARGRASAHMIVPSVVVGEADEGRRFR